MKLGIIRNVFLSNSTYRFNILLNIINVVISISIQIAIWRAIFTDDMVYKSISSSIDLNYMKGYVLLSSMLNICINTNVIEKINEKIKTGQIALDMIRPIKFNSLLLSETIGIILFNIVTQFFIIIGGVIIYRIDIGQYYYGIFFLISVILSMIIYYLISFCLGMLGFWYLEIWHIRRVLDGLIRIFSGAVVPLSFFPEELIIFMKYSPLRCLYDIPISIFLNSSNTKYRLESISVQLFWVVFFVILQRYVYRIGVKKLEIQGG